MQLISDSYNHLNFPPPSNTCTTMAEAVGNMSLDVPFGAIVSAAWRDLVSHRVTIG